MTRDELKISGASNKTAYDKCNNVTKGPKRVNLMAIEQCIGNIELISSIYFDDLIEMFNGELNNLRVIYNVTVNATRNITPNSQDKEIKEGIDALRKVFIIKIQRI